MSEFSTSFPKPRPYTGSEYTIKLGEYPLGYGTNSSHLVISGHDGGGNQIWEVNGMSTDENRSKPIGLPWDGTDTIDFYNTDITNGVLNGDVYFGDQVINQQIIKWGSEESIQYQYEQLKAAGYEINSYDLDYRLLSQNSNSMAGTMLRVLGIDPEEYMKRNGYNFRNGVPGFLNDLRQEKCFPAGTPITLADGSRKAIEKITTSDRVLTFDDGGNPCVGEVVRTYTNTTPEFIRLVFEDGRDDLIATPGHAFLTETGDYLELGHLARLGGGTVRLVDVDGAIVTAKAVRFVYSSETAHLFVTSSTRIAQTDSFFRKMGMTTLGGNYAIRV